MKNLLLSAIIVSAAAMGFIAGGNTVVYAARSTPSSFDYERCSAITHDLKTTNPGVPDHFKEALRTPGGNWCIIE